MSDLYDLRSDRLDQHNQVEAPAYQDAVKAMRALLFDRLEATAGMRSPLRRGDRQAAERKHH